MYQALYAAYLVKQTEALSERRAHMVAMAVATSLAIQAVLARGGQHNQLGKVPVSHLSFQLGCGLGSRLLIYILQHKNPTAQSIGSAN